MKISLTAIVCIMISLTLAACNTLEGVGKDIKKAGQSIENASR